VDDHDLPALMIDGEAVVKMFVRTYRDRPVHFETAATSRLYMSSRLYATGGHCLRARESSGFKKFVSNCDKSSIPADIVRDHFNRRKP